MQREYSEANAATPVTEATPVHVKATFDIVDDRIASIYNEAGPPDYDGAGNPFQSWVFQHHGREAATQVECCGWRSIADARDEGEQTLRYATAWRVYLDAFGCDLGDPHPCPTTDDPATVLRAYETIYNAGDIEALMALFTDESVISGHPFAPERYGLAQIRPIQLRDRAAATDVDPYEFSNVKVTGDTVTWDHIWRNSEGHEYTRHGHEAVVGNGRIISWAWPSE